MEPNKLENQIKTELANREIQPSKAAFDKLDFMLSKKEVKPKVSFTWLHLAASLIVFFAIGVLFWINEPTQNKERVVVEMIQKENKKYTEEEYHEPERVLVAMNEKKPLDLKEKKSTIKNELVLVTQNKDSKPLPVKLISNEIVIKSESIVAVPETPVSSAIQSKIKVDPNILLSKVDRELELSFRDKMLTKINKNYQDVKVALVNRNQQ